jgi:hypothetical protein
VAACMFPRHAEDQRPGTTYGPFAELPLAEGPCPSCTALIDMWEGTMPHVEGLGRRSSVARADHQRRRHRSRAGSCSSQPRAAWRAASPCRARTPRRARSGLVRQSPGCLAWPDGRFEAALRKRAHFRPDGSRAGPPPPRHRRAPMDALRSNPGGRPATDEQIEYEARGCSHRLHENVAGQLGD